MLQKIYNFIVLAFGCLLGIMLFKFGKQSKESEVIKANEKLKKRYEKNTINTSNELSNKLQNGKF